MILSKIQALAACTLASTSLLASSLAFSAANDRNKRPKPDKKEVWSCRAEDSSGSGLFYIGLDEDRGAARSKALETCNRFVDSCSVSCERKL